MSVLVFFRLNLSCYEISLLYSIVYLSALNQTIDLLIDTLVYAIALADQLQHIENESYLSGINLFL